MARGLAWLPLLVLFFGLAWAGWNEYRKLEAYKEWAQQFERAKYDIYAALGQNGDVLTWGSPTRQGIVGIETLNLTEVRQAALEVNAQPVSGDELPSKGRFSLGFTLEDGRHLNIPFTEGEMARQWLDFLLTKTSIQKT
ncbi:MAG: hypothetical protein WA947_03680 [Phormidesmis sp.]